MANPNTYPPAIPVYTRQPVINNLSSTLALTAAQSGSLIILDRAAGTAVTLPTTPAVGTYFDFMVSVTNTSVGNKIITGSATELLVGMIVNCDTDSSDAVAIWKSLVGTANISVTLGGANTTTGGLKGDWVRFTCLNSTTWNVEGNTLATGTVATPFSTS